MDYYSWPSEAAFDAWHADAINALDLPSPGINVATGEPDLDAMWTMAYTSVAQVAEGDWRAPVEPEVAALIPDGLGTPCDPPPTPPMGDL